MASVVLANNGAQWQLEANVPVMCAIFGIDIPANQSNGITITSTCNTERYQLVLLDGMGEARLRAARTSAGSAQISGSTVTITSIRPGYALTTIELTAPVKPGQVTVTLRPI